MYVDLDMSLILGYKTIIIFLVSFLVSFPMVARTPVGGNFGDGADKTNERPGDKA